MAELTPRSDRSDPNRYQALRDAAAEKAPAQTAKEPEPTRPAQIRRETPFAHFDQAQDLGTVSRQAIRADRALNADRQSKAAGNENAQEKPKERQAENAQPENREMSDRKRDALERAANRLAAKLPDRTQDRSQEQQRGRGMEPSR